MKRLLLRGNQIILVSLAISALENLLTLDLRDNFLNAIPHSVVLLKKLETLNVRLLFSLIWLALRLPTR
jgi:Leucine-rich repeat (LRR) protein